MNSEQMTRKFKKIEIFLKFQTSNKIFSHLFVNFSALSIPTKYLYVYIYHTNDLNKL